MQVSDLFNWEHILNESGIVVSNLFSFFENYVWWGIGISVFIAVAIAIPRLISSAFDGNKNKSYQDKLLEQQKNKI